MTVGNNYAINHVMNYGVSGLETPRDVSKGESQGTEATTFCKTPKNSIGEVVAAEVENDITHDDDIGDMFNMAFAGLPFPEMIRN